MSALSTACGVCGAISLILARAIELEILDSETWEGLTWTDVYNLLKLGARDRVSWENQQQGDSYDEEGWDTHYGWGQIDIDASLQWLEILHCTTCELTRDRREPMVRNPPIVFIGLASLAAPTLAQSATVTATHNHPTGLVQPGETIRISFSASWSSAYQLARVVGDAEASPDIGTATNHGGGVGHGPLVHYGTPVLGSVRGVDVATGPNIFGPNPLWSPSPVTFLWYDWTAPKAVGLVEFNWLSHSNFPNAMFYMTSLSVTMELLPTTYIGTSLTVVPAPGGAAAAVAVLAWTRRRR